MTRETRFRSRYSLADLVQNDGYTSCITYSVFFVIVTYILPHHVAQEKGGRADGNTFLDLKRSSNFAALFFSLSRHTAKSSHFMGNSTFDVQTRKSLQHSFRPA